MWSIKEILKNKSTFEKKIRSKIPSFKVDDLIGRYKSANQLKGKLEQIKAEINILSKSIGELRSKKIDANDQMAKVSKLKELGNELTTQYKLHHLEYKNMFDLVPNPPDEDIPISFDPKENKIIYTYGEKPKIDFEPKNHVELNKNLNFFDFTKGSQITGAGWPIYKGLGAKLEWALLNLMLDIHLKNGFEFVLLPHLVTKETMFCSGQLPKFQDQIFKTENNLYLIPTSEVALNGLHYKETFNVEDLPKLYVSYTPCFRKEAGAYGQSERGLIRVHQFNKVELFAFANPDNSQEIFTKIENSIEEVLQTLKLHYRKVLLVTGETSHVAARTVDVEVWLPGQNKYMEASSISNCRDFQSIRSQIKVKQHGIKPYVHTLNGSGLATSRLLVSIIESGQNKDGEITIPEALKKYLTK